MARDGLRGLQRGFLSGGGLTPVFRLVFLFLVFCGFSYLYAFYIDVCSIS